MNLQNILYTRRKDEKGEEVFNFWLIDFANTQKGPIVYDFVNLENEIRLQCISITLWNLIMKRNWEKLRETLDFFINCEMDILRYGFAHLTENDWRMRWYGHKEIEKFYLMINHIREKAGIRGIEKNEYLLSLYYKALLSIKYPAEIDKKKHIDAPLPRILTFLTAGICCGALLKAEV